MKKKIIKISILLTSLIVLGGGYLNKEKYNQNNETLAIFLNEERTETIPSKEEYVFDKAICTVNGNVTEEVKVVWDEEDWAPILYNIKDHSTKCNLYFRNYHVLTIQNNNQTEKIKVPTNTQNYRYEKSIDDTILSCNNEAKLTMDNNTITISNITKDIFCTRYESSKEAISHLDSTANYWLYLKDEINIETLIVPENYFLTIDLNGKTRTGPLSNYGNLELTSTAQAGILNVNTNDVEVFQTYQNSKTLIDNVKIIAPYSTIHSYDNSYVEINSSTILSEGMGGVDSALWMHGGNTVLNVNNSVVTGPFSIGGEGGEITVTDSTITGTSQNGININDGFTGNIKVVGNTKVTAAIDGIAIIEGSVTIQNTEFSPNVKGESRAVVLYGSNSIFNFYGGDLYGKNDIYLNGTTNILEGKEMVNEKEGEYIHTYLQ